MQTAVENAARIEREAIERAREIEREAARKSGEMLEDAFKRAWRILDGIDLMESGVSDMIHALRSEMEGFAADLGIALPGPAADTTRENGKASTPRVAGQEQSHAAVVQMITEQVGILFREGRPRSEAEHLVMRFKSGEEYLHLVDKIYGQAPQ
jgi:hypothetical protein